MRFDEQSNSKKRFCRSDSAAGLCVQKYLGEKHNVKRYEYVNKVCEVSDAIVPQWNEDKTSIDEFECRLVHFDA